MRVQKGVLTAEPSADEAPVVIDLLPPRSGPLAIALPAIGLGLVLAGIGWGILNSAEGFPYAFVSFLGLVALFFGLTLFDRLAARQIIPRVSFFRDHVVLPKLGSRSSLTLRYDEISSLYMVGRGEVERLFIDGRGRLLVFPRAAFGSVEAFSTMSGELWRRIQALPDGSARISEFTKQSAVLAGTMARPVFATKVLLFSIIAMYLLEFGSGAVTRTPLNAPPIGLISLGANARVLIEEGQLFRLVTSMFLHDPMGSSHLHVITNCIALFSLGSLLEQLFGASGVVLMFFVGGVV
ncbi:MAG: rhomboid family intramembrane serine protease, partial [Deltaproteobacteria bacterium]|nr:rhomboid family intramembrane serine protease [Deltaproteobacteria bacterium]